MKQKGEDLRQFELRFKDKVFIVDSKSIEKLKEIFRDDQLKN